MTNSIFAILIGLITTAAGIYLLVLIILVLRKNLRAAPVRREKAEMTKNLGETLRGHRLRLSLA